MRSAPIEKLSISIPRDLAKSVRRRAGARGVSAFAARAMRRELERENLGDYLEELNRELGPVPEELLDEARAAWPRS
jgi:hypothetical protein